jgi:hypothetical protein
MLDLGWSEAVESQVNFEPAVYQLLTSRIVKPLIAFIVWVNFDLSLYNVSSLLTQSKIESLPCRIGRYTLLD